MTHHHTPRPLPRATFGVLAIAFLASLLLLQSCKRADGMTTWTPDSPTPVAYLEDSVLTSRVKAALLLSPVVRSINIGVESHQGVVLLSGMAADPTQLDLAVFVALNVPGVTKVDSFMFSTPIAPAPRNSLSADPPAPLLPQHQREHDRAPRPVLTASDGPQAAQPMAPEGTTGTVAAIAPPSPLRRWIRATYGVLGISSIQDELQIKQ
ncbi:MAG: BON domain-containing protein [Gammaproteobacteria bacterium]|nr:BON domain-containing protein [Gammaproteobacteria bacterium]MBU0829786.1 BON domain-containing protein [Gammaproteobacteria bacterium]MBU1816886.1 BON domain-containing protein [Gammaproteobacteria bacterium]